MNKAGILEFMVAYNPLTWLYELRTRSAIRVLAYHEVDYPVNFEKQLVYLKKNYNVISLDDLAVSLKNNTKLPPRSLVITFDDGERSVLENGLPFFLKYKIPACVFIVTSFIGTTRPLWWQSLRQLFNGRELGEKLKYFKSLSNSERLSEVEILERQHGRSTSYPQLTVHELMKLQEGGVTIANHTHTHPLLDQCSKAEVVQEISQAELVLKNYGFKGHRYFAYPNGNYTTDAETVFQNIGTELAFLFDHKLNHRIVNPYRISRLSVNSNTSVQKLKFILSGLHSRVMGFYQ